MMQRSITLCSLGGASRIEELNRASRACRSRPGATLVIPRLAAAGGQLLHTSPVCDRLQVWPRPLFPLRRFLPKSGSS